MDGGGYFSGGPAVAPFTYNFSYFHFQHRQGILEDVYCPGRSPDLQS